MNDQVPANLIIEIENMPEVKNDTPLVGEIEIVTVPMEAHKRSFMDLLVHSEGWV